MAPKNWDSQNVWGGGGAIEDTHIISDIKMIKIVLSYSQLF